MLLRDDTPEAKKIWEMVEKAAAKAPDWLREKIEKAVDEKNEQTPPPRR